MNQLLLNIGTKDNVGKMLDQLQSTTQMKIDGNRLGINKDTN